MQVNEPAIEIRRATPADAASLAVLRHEFRAGLDTTSEKPPSSSARRTLTHVSCHGSGSGSNDVVRLTGS